jgi:hypothetical protein
MDVLTCVEFVLCGCGRFEKYGGAADRKGNVNVAVFNGDGGFAIKGVVLYAVPSISDLIGV